jgi:hypothetical protein
MLPLIKEGKIGVVRTYLLPSSEALRAQPLVGFEVFDKDSIYIKEGPFKQVFASVG